ncbi:MAG: PilZ domain-containing protein [Candidatus Omnitrophota bacterium]|nr:PilZ domain-containing protein [Candidatus Omnitrophota bacterium]
MALLLKQRDNRSLPRVDFCSNIRFQIRGKPDFDNAITKDISFGGLRFASDRFVPTSTPIMLEINVLNRVLRPIARVAWSTPLPHSSRNQTGVEFVEFNILESRYLKDFINMQLG